MSMRVYNMFYSATADVDQAVSLSFQEAGFITMVHMSLIVNAAIDNVRTKGELSFSPAYQGDVNDTVGPIAFVQSQSNFVTSGLDYNSTNVILPGLRIPVKIGNRIYLNTGDLVGAQVSQFKIFVYVMPSSGMRRR